MLGERAKATTSKQSAASVRLSVWKVRESLLLAAKGEMPPGERSE